MIYSFMLIAFLTGSPRVGQVRVVRPYPIRYYIYTIGTRERIRYNRMLRDRRQRLKWKNRPNRVALIRAAKERKRQRFRMLRERRENDRQKNY